MVPPAHHTSEAVNIVVQLLNYGAYRPAYHPRMFSYLQTFLGLAIVFQSPTDLSIYWYLSDTCSVDTDHMNIAEVYSSLWRLSIEAQGAEFSHDSIFSTYTICLALSSGV